MKKILVIIGHPRKTTFCEALAEKYAEGAKVKGAEIRILYLSELRFDSAFLKQDDKHEQKLEPDLVQVQRDIMWANHMTMLFPIWWGYPPALFKGFIDRVFTMGFACNYSAYGMPVGLLKGRSSRIIVTMDAPPLFSRLFYGDYGIRSIKRSILMDAGFKPNMIIKYGPLYGSTQEQRAKWLKEASKLGMRDAR
jgi:putative NADPH-quinone reductase